MNIVQKIDEFSTNDIILCEPIKNTIMDNSNFIRILISNKDIIINGVYLFFNIKAKNYYDRTLSYNSYDKHKYKKMLFLISSDANKEVIDQADVELLSKINTETKRNGKKISSVEIIDNKSIKVKNINQFKYMEIISNSTVTFGIGPAGTGKTFLAVASAVKLYAENKIRKKW